MVPRLELYSRKSRAQAATRLHNVGHPELRRNEGNIRSPEQGELAGEYSGTLVLLARVTQGWSGNCHLPQTAVKPARSRSRVAVIQPVHVGVELPNPPRTTVFDSGCQANPKRGARRRNWFGYCPVAGNNGFSPAAGRPGSPRASPFRALASAKPGKCPARRSRSKARKRQSRISAAWLKLLYSREQRLPDSEFVEAERRPKSIASFGSAPPSSVSASRVRSISKPNCKCACRSRSQYGRTESTAVQKLFRWRMRRFP